MDSIFPCVAESLHLFWLTADVLALAVLDIPGKRRNLPIGIEFDAVGRIDVDALDLPAQVLALGEACHHVQAVAENHAVRPMLTMLVELEPRLRIGQSIEIGE